MSIEALNKVHIVPPTGLDQLARPGQADFADLLDQALQNIEQAETAAQDSTVRLLTGQDDSIHSIMLAAEKSQLALNLLIQVRNKVLDAYKEIMQMQV